MPGVIRKQIGKVNAQIGALLEDSRQALRGERSFGLEEVRALSQPIAEMDCLISRAQAMKATEPEVEAELALYKRQLSELHTALEQVRMMLIARRGRTEEARKHLDAVSRWATATRLIR